MYVNDTTQSSIGYRSVAVPSELHGFWTAFTRFGSGKVSWQRLVTPSAELAANGFPVSNNLAETLKKKEKEIQEDEHMKNEFVDPATGRVYEEGDELKRENLAMTLQLIANDSDPVGLFYKHGMAQSIASEFRLNGGLITAKDLADYQTVVDENPLLVEDLPGGLAMCGPPPPSSFVITQSIFRTMAKFYDGWTPVDLNDPLVHHRYIEAQKFAYAQRTKLGDWKFVESAKGLVNQMLTPEFITKMAKSITNESQNMDVYTDVMSALPEDHGTSHVSAIDDEGNAVSCTSTVNLHFGSLRISPTLGIIWNDEMDDFSTPGVPNAFGFAPSETNFIRPGKKPMSSMSPVVVFNAADNEVKLVTGAAGGSYIISSVANTLVRTLLFNQTVKEAIDAPRLHHQFIPYTTTYEEFVPKEIINALRDQYKQNMTSIEKIPAVVHALEVMSDGYIHGNSDFRRKTATYPSGF